MIPNTCNSFFFQSVECQYFSHELFSLVKCSWDILCMGMYRKYSCIIRTVFHRFLTLKVSVAYYIWELNINIFLNSLRCYIRKRLTGSMSYLWSRVINEFKSRSWDILCTGMYCKYSCIIRAVFHRFLTVKVSAAYYEN